ncbi:MAG TPA: VWA domain-containing protein [Chloroflexota bacterium]|jgi:hypothetical protein|nr:VWA domain-containing protein [Chloroflexota bacterium]
MIPALESPAALALALTVPAILGLWLLRPRRPRRRVPSVMLWPASPAERRSARPWQRLRNHRLLWLQIAAATALTLAAARPFLPADAAGRHLVVLLDASGSMRAQDASLRSSAGADAPDRFARAKERVIELAQGLGPDQELTLIRVDAEPRALLTTSRDPAAVAAALGPEAAGLGPADLPAALELAAALSAGPAEWVLVGDGGLDPGDARLPAGVAFRHLVVGRPAGNVAVTGLVARADAPSTSLRTSPSAPGAGATVALQAGLRNAGPEPVAGRLQLLAAPAGGDPQLISAREWRLEPNAETHLTWTGLPASAGRFEVRLSGVPPSANALGSDDRAWATLGAPAETTVLLVGPGNTFLERALAVVGGVRAFRAAPGDWPGLAAPTSASAEVYPLTVLDRLWPEARPGGNALYVGPPLGPEFRPAQLWPKSDHPLLRHVDWSEVRVGRARRVSLDTLGADWETVVDSDGGPLLAVRQDGRRREALIAFELGQSDLPLRPAFPVLMANLLEWLLPRGEGAPRTIAPGAAARIEPSPLATEVWVEDGDGRRELLAPPWPPRPFRPAAPGLYRVVQVGGGAQRESDLIAEGYHPAEAELAPRELALPAADGAAAAAQGTRVLWPLLAGAVLALGLLEWWVDARGS